MRYSGEVRDGNWVYSRLRHEIENLILEPGTELDVLSLTELYGVSRSPVRDALLRLQRDSLVDIFPQRGTRVSFIDIHQVLEERFMRKSVELNVIEMLFQKERTEIEKEAFITLLRSNLMQQQAAFISSNYIEFLKVDDELHHMFFSNLNLERTWSVLKAHTGNEYRIRMLSYKAAGVASHVIEQHTALVDALESGEKEKAIEIDRSHLSKILGELDSLKISFPKYFTEVKTKDEINTF